MLIFRIKVGSIVECHGLFFTMKPLLEGFSEGDLCEILEVEHMIRTPYNYSRVNYQNFKNGAVSRFDNEPQYFEKLFKIPSPIKLAKLRIKYEINS